MGKLSIVLGPRKSGEMMEKGMDDMPMHSDEEDSEDMGDESGKVDAAKLVMKAIKSGDASALSEALTDFYGLC